MSSSFARPLDDNQAAAVFLTRALGFKPCDDTGDLAVKVAKAEVLLSKMAAENTLKRPNFRHPSYSSDEARKELRRKIFSELIGMNRIANDDEIRLGVGGISPPVGQDISNQRKAFILIGLPASGKSTISNKIADAYGAYIVDSDYAKRKFPEYKDEYGAALVHEESTLVTFGMDGNDFADELNVLEYCISQEVNVVIPKIGSKAQAIRDLRALLIGFEYEVHLVLVKADRVCATQRALTRFQATNRYVPISLIFDGYGNDPILSYYYLCKEVEWHSVGIISTETNPPEYIESSKGSPIDIFRVEE
ncbi:zeta toxin family protein [Pseudomonas sp. GNP012]